MRTRFGSNAPFGSLISRSPVLRHRQIVLADLIVLRQIGIVVLFAIPLRERRNFAVERDRRLAAQAETPRDSSPAASPAADAHRARLRIRLGAKLRAASAEQLARRGKLHVDFEADDSWCTKDITMSEPSSADNHIVAVLVSSLCQIIGRLVAIVAIRTCAPRKQPIFFQRRSLQLQADRQARF